MSEQGGALARLRAAIIELVKGLGGVCSETFNLTREGPALLENAKNRQDAAVSAVEAELAAVEARIGRLVRFVRAWDDLKDAIAGWPEGTERRADHYCAAVSELRQARAALTDEDLT